MWELRSFGLLGCAFASFLVFCIYSDGDLRFALCSLGRRFEVKYEYSSSRLELRRPSSARSDLANFSRWFLLVILLG